MRAFLPRDIWRVASIERSVESPEMRSHPKSKFRDALDGYLLNEVGVISRGSGTPSLSGAPNENSTKLQSLLRDSLEARLFEATPVALEGIDPFATNYEVLCALHQAFQRWASTLPPEQAGQLIISREATVDPISAAG
jgi:hypothetical protein